MQNFRGGMLSHGDRWHETFLTFTTSTQPLHINSILLCVSITFYAQTQNLDAPTQFEWLFVSL